jgi:hypothetical protein
MQNKAVFYFHFDIFIFENKVAGDKMPFAWVWIGEFISIYFLISRINEMMIISVLY